MPQAARVVDKDRNSRGMTDASSRWMQEGNSCGEEVQAADWMRQGPPDCSVHYSVYGEPKPAQPSEASRCVDADDRRYVSQCAYVGWAHNFGANCESPDFERVRVLLRHQRMVSLRHAVRRELPSEITGLILACGGVMAWLLKRRRRRTGP